MKELNPNAEGLSKDDSDANEFVDQPVSSPEENVSDQPKDAAPTDAFQGSLPHPVEENPEDHIGDETADPWADETQTDWPQNDGETVNDPTPTSVDNPVYTPDQEKE